MVSRHASREGHHTPITMKRHAGSKTADAPYELGMASSQRATACPISTGESS
ncbi:hypothetical protein SAMN05877962_109139 [Alloalcanivorax xenomutans]|jgi:hypothetical protein|nr:hypothetical protein SAMN05877962_109139 [Alloalcanivorax xenomutans]